MQGGKITMNCLDLSTGMALFLGMLHTLEPGHGKTAIVAYMVSGKRTWVDGAVISLSSVLSHTFVVLVMALSISYLTNHSDANGMVWKTTHILSAASGFIIMAIGLYFILKSFYGHKHASSCSSCSKSLGEEKGIKQKEGKKKNKVFTSSILGIAMGMAPCPTLVAAYLSGIASENFFLGVQSILIFSLGMFISMMSVITLVRISGAKILDKAWNGKNTFLSRLSDRWQVIQGAALIIIGLIIFFCQ